MSRILFTSVGRRVVFIRMVRDAARRLGLDVEFIGTDIDPLASALHDVDVRVEAPPWSSVAYGEFLLDLATRRDVDLIVPLTDPDAALLAEMRSEFERRGSTVCTVSPNHVDTIDDKWETARFFREAGVLVPGSWLEMPRLTEGTSLLLKPRRGSAGAGIRVVEPGREEPVPDGYLVQQRVSGPEVTVDAFCSHSGEVVSMALRERIEVRAGEVSKARTIRHAQVEREVRSLVPELGAVGPITVQCILTERGPEFIEINGRVGGGAPLGIEAGSVADELLLSLCADGAAHPAPVVARPDCYMTRFDDQYFTRSPPSFDVGRA